MDPCRKSGRKGVDLAALQQDIRPIAESRLDTVLDRGQQNADNGIVTDHIVFYNIVRVNLSLDAQLHHCTC